MRSPPACARTPRRGRPISSPRSSLHAGNRRQAFADAVSRYRAGSVAASEASDLKVLDPARGQARATSRRADTAELEEADDPRALAAERLEELQHPRVVAARLARQREGDQARQVEVTDADGVRVAERPDADLGRRPRPDARYRRQPRIGVGAAGDRRSPRTRRRVTRRAGSARLVAARSRTGGTRNRGGSPAPPGSGPGGAATPEGPGAGSPWARIEPVPGAPCLLAGDLLLEDRGHEGLEDSAGARDPDARAPSRQFRHERMSRRDRNGLAAKSEERRDVRQRADRARPPRLGRDLVAAPG